MTEQHKDVSAELTPRPLIVEITFVGSGLVAIGLTLVKIFERNSDPSELSLLEVLFFFLVYSLCAKAFAKAKLEGRSRWAMCVDLSIILSVVLLGLRALTAGVEWLAGHYGGLWLVTERILASDLMWLSCFLFAIFTQTLPSTPQPTEGAVEAKA